jgi:hypothetical protein
MRAPYDATCEDSIFVSRAKNLEQLRMSACGDPSI